MRKIDESVVHADVSRAIGQWRRAGVRHLDRTPTPEAATGAALALLSGTRPSDPALMARFCVATKGPHLRHPMALACVAARMTAFGVTVRGLHRVDDPDRVVRALYPKALSHFRHGPMTPAYWDRISQRFATDTFAAIFGRPYEPSMVVSGVDVIRSNALSPEDLTRVWEDGRRPVDRDTLVRRYGPRAADLILQGRDTYSWFRGPLPVGISRIATGLTAFAMRDERINHGEPVIVVNGHVAGLAGMFAPATWVFDLGVDDDAPDIGDVRRFVAGDDSRPDRCRPGTVRRDAVDGSFPLGGDDPISSRSNLLHCSDGLLAGLLEVHGLIPDEAGREDLLHHRLLRAGLTRQEITDIVLQNPTVKAHAPAGNLTDLTAGSGVGDCVAEILHAVPPVFGPANGLADGLTLAAVAGTLQHGLDGAAERRLQIGRAPGHGPAVGRIVAQPVDEAAGREAIRTGLVGMLIPAGGTGGRFGGYDVAEADPARQKTLARVFAVAGRPMSAMDIRLANIRYWDADGGDRIPVAVMSSPTSDAELRQWRAALDEPYRKSLRIFGQHGIYRLDAEVAPWSRRWIDAILRDDDGRPSVKPAGSLPLLSSFVLSGMLQGWRDDGVEFIGVANGDDVGFRIDPRVIGHLVRNDDVDAVVIGVPWGFTATVRRRGSTIGVRGDRSGWVVDEYGRPVADPVPDRDRVYDSGGALCFTPGRADPSLSIVESGQPVADLFNTNQFYLRVSAIQRLLQRTGAVGTPAAVRRIRDTAVIYLEDKAVTIDDRGRQARQIVQHFHAVLQWMTTCRVLTTTRRIGPDTRSSYATLKRRADIGFAQMIVDQLEQHRAELALGNG